MPKIPTTGSISPEALGFFGQAPKLSA